LGAQPDITIVIPTRDEGEWLRRTIDAVLATTAGHDIEIVVVDDGSVDGSADYLRGPDAPSVVRLVQGGQLGVARARNLGAEHARGAKLVFLDANVVPDQGWLDAISSMLDTPDAGLVSVGVRDYENPASVGYSCVFVDERLQEGWAPRPAPDDPFEVACIIGCCCGIRRELFESLGLFDTGHVRWGVEDLELGLRCWFTGRRNLVDPSVQVAHFFKHNKPRNFSVSWQQYDHNLLRCVLTYLTGRRAAMILTAAGSRPSFAAAVASGLGDAAYWERRRNLRARFTRDEEAFFAHFATQFARFEARVAELMPDWAPTWSWAPPGAIDYDTRILAAGLASSDDASLDDVLWGLARRGSLAPALERLTNAGYFCDETHQPPDAIREDLAGFARWARQEREAAVPVFRKVVCPSCGATNMGVQEICMICKAALPALELNPAQPAPEPLAPDLPPVSQVAVAESPLPMAEARPVEQPAIVAERICARCGARLPDIGRFCIECGTPWDAAAPAPASPAAPVCSKCGSQLPSGTRFCINCGTPVTA
jgi:GT2 family glycosyltransferase/ribosomal protein L40E